MNRANLTEGEQPSRLPLRQQYATAVADVIAGEREVARAQAAQAARVEKARLACVAMGFTDTSTGGPRWSDEVVTQRLLVTELAVALRLSEVDARRRVDTAAGLSGVFAATRTALEAGTISYRHAEKIVEHAAALPPECLTDYEARLLPVASRVSVQRLVRHARAAVEVAQPSTAIERHQAAAAERRITLDPADDGMAYLTHYLPAVEAVAVFNRATDLARGLKSAGDPRTLTQLRADSLTDLMLNGESSIPGATSNVRAHVQVTVPALTLLRDDREAGVAAATTAAGADVRTSAGAEARPSAGAEARPGAAHLDGYGPIDRLTALELTRDAPGFYRVLTDPATGVALSYGRTRYRPPVELDQLIRTVHSECTFPLDCVGSARADLDHTQPWEDGAETSFRNLSPLCSSHHKVKHHTEWQVSQDSAGSGVITWTSPAGFEYVVDPTPIAQRMPMFVEAPPSPPRDEPPPY